MVRRTYCGQSTNDVTDVTRGCSGCMHAKSSTRSAFQMAIFSIEKSYLLVHLFAYMKSAFDCFDKDEFSYIIEFEVMYKSINIISFISKTRLFIESSRGVTKC